MSAEWCWRCDTRHETPRGNGCNREPPKGYKPFPRGMAKITEDMLTDKERFPTIEEHTEYHSELKTILLHRKKGLELEYENRSMVREELRMAAEANKRTLDKGDTSLAPWDENGWEQQSILIKYPGFSEKLKKKLPDLQKSIDLDAVWIHFRKWNVLTKEAEQRLRYNKATPDIARTLFEKLPNYPEGKAHAFMKALYDSGQEHIIYNLGINPDFYKSKKTARQLPWFLEEHPTVKEGSSDDESGNHVTLPSATSVSSDNIYVSPTPTIITTTPSLTNSKAMNSPSSSSTDLENPQLVVPSPSVTRPQYTQFRNPHTYLEISDGASEYEYPLNIDTDEDHAVDSTNKTPHSNEETLANNMSTMSVHEETASPKELDLSMEKDEMSNQLMITGIPEKEDEDLFHIFRDVCRDLGINIIRRDLILAKRMDTFVKRKPLPILIHCNNIHLVECVYARKHKLKHIPRGQNVYINRVESEATKDRRYRCRVACRSAREQGVSARITSDGVIIDGKEYSLEEVGDIPECFSESNGADNLRK